VRVDEDRGSDDGALTVSNYRARLWDRDDAFETLSRFASARIAYEAPSPFIGTALHAIHRLRPEVRDLVVASESERRLEEDPETHRFLGLFTHTIVSNQSRFEVDMNRTPDQAVYERPDMAWGIKVLDSPLPRSVRQGCLDKWYEFQSLVDAAVEDAIQRFGRAFVFDIHSYNYQRDGPTDWRADGKPVINLGTRHLRLDERGRGEVEWLLDRLKEHTVEGERLSVEENGVFGGGYLNQRLSRQFGPKCITLSIEYKKVYMDERADTVQQEVLEGLVEQFHETIRGFARRIDAPLRARPAVPSI
jgi:N-formylglutamate amidohydrolase